MAPLSRRIVDRLLGALERRGGAVARSLRAGRPARRALSLRAPGSVALPDEVLLAGLSDPAPGVRSAAAWALGQRAGEGAAALSSALRSERCDGPRLAMAVAAVRLGVPVAEAWAALARTAGREICTAYGPRPVGALCGAGRSEVARRWVRALDPTAPPDRPEAVVPRPRAALLDGLRAALREDSEDLEALLALAAQQQPEDRALLESLEAGAGRRSSLALLRARGDAGDPAALPRLLATLAAVDTDPGFGFASRAAAAEALGRLGLPEAAGPMLRALQDEAQDFEGRPGAGLGIQRPVRAAILAALGELGEPTVLPTLLGYLDDTTGSAQGGLYLPALDALWKLGQEAPLRALLDRPGTSEVAAANAVGVLGALGGPAAVRRWLGDPRPPVAAAAEGAVAILGPGVA